MTNSLNHSGTQNSLVDAYWIIGISAVVLLVLSIFIVFNIGKITLSGQTVGHRRNILLAFSLIVLTQMKILNLDVLKPIGLYVNSTKYQSNIATGLLVVFVIYSFIEYTFTFLSDYRSSTETATQTGFKSVATLLVGIYRLLFDITLPVLALLITCYTYSDNAKQFMTKAIDTLRNDYQNVDTSLISAENKQEIKEKVEKEICQKCPEALANIQRLLPTITSCELYKLVGASKRYYECIYQNSVYKQPPTITSCGLYKLVGASNRYYECMFQYYIFIYRQHAKENPTIYLPNVAETLDSLGYYASTDNNRWIEIKKTFKIVRKNLKKLRAKKH